MSTTPTPSASSEQSLYYDAPVMHSPDLYNVNKEGQRSSSEPRSGVVPPSHFAVPGATEGANQPSHPEETDLGAKSIEGDSGQSLRSLPTEGQEGEVAKSKPAYGQTSSPLARKESVRTARSTHTTGTASAFANGAPLTGPDAEPDVDPSLFQRSAKAERALSQKQKDRIVKKERKESKRFSKLLKTESSTEKVALDSALNTLSALQNLHKEAIRREGRAEASHARALSAAQKAEGKFQEEKARTAELRARAETRCMEERARWEGKEGEVQAQQERLSSARATVKEAEARIAECAREVERLRIVKATDEREREAKLVGMAGQK